MVLNVGMYLLGDRIGGAGVRVGTHKRTGVEYAVKSLSKAELRARGMSNAVKREVAAMGAIAHPNVVGLHEVLSSPSKLYLVMELVRGADLSSHVAALPSLALPAARRLFRQLCAGLAYCHAHAVFHGALEPAHALVAPDGTLKVTGFGVFAEKEEEAEAAAEDAAAAGGILAMLLRACGRKAESAWGLVGELTHSDPGRRPSMEEVARHPWMQGREVDDGGMPPNHVDLLTTMDVLGPPPPPLMETGDGFEPPREDEGGRDGEFRRERSYEEAEREQESYGEPSRREESFEEPPRRKESFDEPPARERSFEEPPHQEERFATPPSREDRFVGPPSREDSVEEPPVIEESDAKLPRREESFDDPPLADDSIDQLPHEAESDDEPPQKDDSADSTVREDRSLDAQPPAPQSPPPPRDEDFFSPPPSQTESLRAFAKRTESLRADSFGGPLSQIASLQSAGSRDHSVVDGPRSIAGSVDAPPSTVESVEAPPSTVESIDAPPSTVESIEAPPSTVESIDAPPSTVDTVDSIDAPPSTVESVDVPAPPPPHEYDPHVEPPLPPPSPAPDAPAAAGGLRLPSAPRRRTRSPPPATSPVSPASPRSAPTPRLPRGPPLDVALAVMSRGPRAPRAPPPRTARISPRHQPRSVAPPDDHAGVSRELREAVYRMMPGRLSKRAGMMARELARAGVEDEGDLAFLVAAENGNVVRIAAMLERTTEGIPAFTCLRVARAMVDRDYARTR